MPELHWFRQEGSQKVPSLLWFQHLLRLQRPGMAVGITSINKLQGSPSPATLRPLEEGRGAPTCPVSAP